MDKRTKKKKINPNEFAGLLYDHREIEAVRDILLSDKIFRYSSREESITDRLEKSVENHLGIKYALGLNSGTSALKAALISLGIKHGERVLVSAYTFIATPAAVISIGAIPVPIDLDLETGMNLKQLESEIKKGCAAIIPVHIQGQAFNLSPVVKLAHKNHVPVIEDACQAFGTKYRSKYAGCFGDVGVFSFQQYKQISSGEGGMLVTNKKRLFNKAKIYSDHGVVREFRSWDKPGAMIGDNLRIDNLHSAILNIQLDRLPKVIASQKNKRNTILNNIKNSSEYLIKSPDATGITGMNLLFLMPSANQAEKVISSAKNHGIEFRYLWDRPYYLHGVFNKAKLTPKYLKTSRCKNAEDISKRLISLSIPPTLSKADLQRIVTEIKTWKNFI